MMHEIDSKLRNTPIFLNSSNLVTNDLCEWEKRDFRDEAIGSVKSCGSEPRSPSPRLVTKKKLNSEALLGTDVANQQKKIVHQKVKFEVGHDLMAEMTFRSHFLFGTFRQSHKNPRNPNKTIWVSVCCRQKSKVSLR